MKNQSDHPPFTTIILIVFSLTVLVYSAYAQDPSSGGQSPNSFRKSQTKLHKPKGTSSAKKIESLKFGNRTLVLPEEFRTITGEDNNEANPTWGATEVHFLRIVPADYADGISEPSGENRPSAREISNNIMNQESDIFSRVRATNMVWQWGQFLDHDITLTPESDPSEAFDITVPADDRYFTNDIPLSRSFFELEDGVAQQVNELSAYIDASNVYGSDPERASALRTNDGNGKLLTSDGNMLPFNTTGLPNAPSSSATDFFLAGDFRANENVGLTSMHTIFVREHNYWAEAISKANADLDGDQIYEAARIIVAAEMQIITYREFLPIILGRRGIPKYKGYNPEINAGISNSFATAGYRFGHTMLPAELIRIDKDGDEISAGHLDLADAFFKPSILTDPTQGGIEPIIRGLARQTAQEVDAKIIDDVRNFLFGAPGSGGFDLAALNIQRGRDHGLADYNTVRKAFGLKKVKDFDDITSNEAVAAALEETYTTVDDLDLWVAALAEDKVREGLVGETMAAILTDQFVRLRDGDRFWYQNYLDPTLQRLLEAQSLCKIICRNTDIGLELPRNVFIAKLPPTRNPRNVGPHNEGPTSETPEGPSGNNHQRPPHPPHRGKGKGPR